MEETAFSTLRYSTVTIRQIAPKVPPRTLPASSCPVHPPRVRLQMSKRKNAHLIRKSREPKIHQSMNINSRASLYGGKAGASPQPATTTYSHLLDAGLDPLDEPLEADLPSLVVADPKALPRPVEPTEPLEEARGGGG